MSNRVDSHSQTPRICICDIENAHVRCVSPILPPQGKRTMYALTPPRHHLPVLCESFADVIEEALRKCLTKIADERCGHIRDAIYTLIMHPFGKIERKNPA